MRRAPLALLALPTLAACATAAPPSPVAVTSAPPPHTVAPRVLAAREEPPRERRYSLERDGLPPEFAYLPPRDREQWHACRPFFMRRRPADGASGGAGRPAIHLEFTLHVTDYLREPDAAARRALLIEHGCPDSLVDLADGTHLDLVEGPKDH